MIKASVYEWEFLLSILNSEKNIHSNKKWDLDDLKSFCESLPTAVTWPMAWDNMNKLKDKYRRAPQNIKRKVRDIGMGHKIEVSLRLMYTFKEVE